MAMTLWQSVQCCTLKLACNSKNPLALKELKAFKNEHIQVIFAPFLKSI